jgi:activator of HSP90 ATPase
MKGAIMPFEFTVSDVIPATPQQIYDAWLDSKGHANITGGAPAKVSAKEGDKFTAWDGYISGKNVKLESGKRIVQTWRTTEFKKSDPDSQIEITLEPVTGGTQLTLHHTNVPDGQTEYESGWQENYFDTMKEFFGS